MPDVDVSAFLWALVQVAKYLFGRRNHIFQVLVFFPLFPRYIFVQHLPYLLPWGFGVLLDDDVDTCRDVVPAPHLVRLNRLRNQDEAVSRGGHLSSSSVVFVVQRSVKLFAVRVEHVPAVVAREALLPSQQEVAPHIGVERVHAQRDGHVLVQPELLQRHFVFRLPQRCGQVSYVLCRYVHHLSPVSQPVLPVLDVHVHLELRVARLVALCLHFDQVSHIFVRVVSLCIVHIHTVLLLVAIKRVNSFILD
mmetsp:Transcript_37490/g.73767  ORF Transcript_37490/g.73767 Transcript_37490/m.73767 type:complete len:250 (-) Transcript_37490:2368-3117(-)